MEIITTPPTLVWDATWMITIKPMTRITRQLIFPPRVKPVIHKVTGYPLPGIMMINISLFIAANTRMNGISVMTVIPTPTIMRCSLASPAINKALRIMIITE